MRVKQLRLLGEAVGFKGMALGQTIDLESEGKVLSIDQLKIMHTKKTGALITASILMGAVCGNPNKLGMGSIQRSWRGDRASLPNSGRYIGPDSVH